MSNEKFKVKFGLAVGDTVTTIDGTTGDVVTTGDIAVNGGDITTTSTTANIVNATATTVNIGGAGTTVSIGANTGTTTVNNSLVADDISVTTVDTTNLEVTNIKALDGTAAASIANSTGAVTITTQLTVDNININGNTLISTDTNGAITLDPNGTGNVVCTFSNGGNITNDRNYITGAIRNATTRDTNGDIWELNTSGAQSATNPYFRGVSLSNSSDTTRGPATLMRSYTGNATAGAPGSGSAQRGRVIFEKARGFPEGVSSGPSAVQSGDILGSIDVTGYSSTGWLNDTIPAVTGFFGFAANENWVSNTALGTTFTLTLAPTSTTISTGANLTQVLNLSPQSGTYRSDVHTFNQGKTGTMQYLDISTTRANFGVPVQVPAFLATAVNGTLATTGASGTGSVATLTFGALASAPYTVGSTITVAGVTPLGYNGDYSVTACTTTTVSYASTTTGAQTVAGTIKLQVGTVGRQIAISDSAGGSHPNGMMAFWDTTDGRWSYIHDNSAV
jgi:hypothetical protein